MAGVPARRILIVGVGALGSHVVQFLRNEGELTVIDFDRVERKNTLAQFHGVTSVARNKASALQGLMQLLWQTKIDAKPHKVTKLNVEGLVRGYDLVIDCLDNLEGRLMLREHVEGRPLLHSALAPDGALGCVGWSPEMWLDDAETQGAATCEGGEHLPFIALVAACTAHTARSYLREGTRLSSTVLPSGKVIQM